MDNRPEHDTEAIKLLEENTKVNLCDLGLGHDFLHITPKTQTRKTKTDKLSFFKIKSLFLRGHH